MNYRKAQPGECPCEECKNRVDGASKLYSVCPYKAGLLKAGYTCDRAKRREGGNDALATTRTPNTKEGLAMRLTEPQIKQAVQGRTASSLTKTEQNILNKGNTEKKLFICVGLMRFLLPAG